MRPSLLLLICALLSGCQHGIQHRNRRPDIHVRIENTGDVTIDDAFVKFGERQSVRRGLPPGGGTTHLFFADEIPDECTIIFRVDGQFTEQRICLTDFRSSTEDEIMLVFRIDGSARTVTVREGWDF